MFCFTMYKKCFNISNKNVIFSYFGEIQGAKKEYICSYCPLIKNVAEHLFFLNILFVKRIILCLLFFLTGLFVGGGWFLYRLQAVEKSGGLAQSNGNWKYNPSMDLATNEFRRAVIGKIGLLALRESEVLYYLTSQDSEGRPLSSDYTYQLDGKNFNARYWSYTLYGEDHFLVSNGAKVYSLNLDNIQYTDSSRINYTIFISKNKTRPNWLPSGEGEKMSVLLRMYNPERSIYEKMDQVELPVIHRIGS